MNIAAMGLTSVYIGFILSWFSSAYSNTTQVAMTTSPGIGVMLPLQASALVDLDTSINRIDGDGSGVDFSHMYFGTDNSSVVTSQTGSTAHLPCIVHNAGDGVVSWIRRKEKDRHLITVGVSTYNADQRYQIIHPQHTEDWTLQIKFVQRRDAGLYECQVSSHPPTSIFIQLNVVEAKAQISGPSEKYLKPGSTLRLQCVVLKATETPSYIFWYHNSRMVNFDIDLGVNVSTDLSIRTSSLTIPITSANHAGNYSCTPNNAHPASIYVHIFNGENPAAMQSSADYKKISLPCSIILYLFTQVLSLRLLFSLLS